MKSIPKPTGYIRSTWRIITTLSKYTSNPGITHWQALMHVLRYIKKMLHYKITYGCYISSPILDVASRTWVTFHFLLLTCFVKCFTMCFTFHFIIRFTCRFISSMLPSYCFIQRHPHSCLPGLLHMIPLCISHIFNSELQIYKPIVLCQYSLVYTL
jgi:hypothetical protein